MRKKLLLFVAFVIVVLAAFWLFGSKHAAAPKRAGTTTGTKQQNSFNKNQYSPTNPSSLWVVVNKQHPLQPISYVPAGLRYPNVKLRVPGIPEMQMRSVAAKALEKMFAGASDAGYKLEVSTAYRGYSYQKSLYASYVASVGKAAADQESARPGTSEHQTGLAVDIRNQSDTCSLEASFGSTPEGKWLAANAYRYGFILRYPQGKEALTGYEYEPWHFRYVGTALSQQMHKTGTQTLEQFFGISGGTTYK